MPSNKPYFNTRLTPLAIHWVLKLKDHYGVSQSGVMEILIRNAARELGFKQPSQAELDRIDREYSADTKPKK